MENNVKLNHFHFDLNHFIGDVSAKLNIASWKNGELWATMVS